MIGVVSLRPSLNEMIVLTPKEFELLYKMTENPEVEIDDKTKDKFIKAAREGFTAEMTLSLKHPITMLFRLSELNRVSQYLRLYIA